LARIFVAFAQGDHAVNGGPRLFGGLGLGLSIARTLTELHAGTIRAESRGLNQGSNFLIELPLVSATADQKTSLAGATSKPVVAEGERLGRILLVEDHEGTRNALGRLLICRHYEVVSVASFADAQLAVNNARFDLLVSDIGLSDGSGYELMADLQSRFGMKGIALTGFGEAEDIARSQKAGFSAHITKPASIQSLEQALKEVGFVGPRS
jgi:CheY-like chemotaxis protein